jgi:hypothetical protein
MDKITKVFFIMGAGHSGSTLLDIVLSSHRKGVGSGEFVWLPRRYQEEPTRICSCKKRYAKCDVWSSVFNEWYKKIGRENIDRFLALQSKFEQPRSPTLYFLQKDKILSDPNFKDYCEMLSLLYQVLAETTQSDFVVDSSKLPTRGFVLSKCQGVDLRLIHLVRDPRAVGYSKIKRQAFKPSAQHPVRAVFGWALHNKQCDQVAKNLPVRKRSVIKYEELVSNPASTLKRIEEVGDEDFSAVIDQTIDHKPIEIGHIPAGNQIRFRQTIMLRADFSWKKKLSKAEKSIYWWLSLGHGKKYGYDRSSDLDGGA